MAKEQQFFAATVNRMARIGVLNGGEKFWYQDECGCCVKSVLVSDLTDLTPLAFVTANDTVIRGENAEHLALILSNLRNRGYVDPLYQSASEQIRVIINNLAQLSETPAGGEEVVKKLPANLPGGYCGICAGHSHSAKNCPTIKNKIPEVEVPVATCSCHPIPIPTPTPFDFSALNRIAESLATIVRGFKAVEDGRVKFEKVWVNQPADNFNGGTQLIETTDYRIVIEEEAGE